MRITVIVSVVLLWSVFAQVTLLAHETVEVLRPNSSDTLQPGTTFRIQWRVQGITNNTDWTFIFHTNNAAGRWVYPTPVYDGDGNWHADLTIPSDLPSRCDYTLFVGEDITDAADYSDVFCLGVPQVSIQISQVQVCWSSRADRMYQVQYRSPLTTDYWTNLGASVQGNGTTNCVTDAVVPSQPQRYYRVVELP